jgi:hypothetical protein
MNRSSEIVGQINFFASITGRFGRMCLIFQDEPHVSRNISGGASPDYNLEFGISSLLYEIR